MLIDIVINNRSIKVRSTASVLQACEEAGYIVPRFCYHEQLSIAGNCRMCLVEVQKSPKPVVSCAMPVSKGMVIFTDTPIVKKAREAVLEFLLINHPLDCPICDQGGECDLQDETLQYGSDRGRYYEFKRSVEDKECGPIIKTIMTRCIHCTRCIRFSSEIAGQETMGSFGRGQDTEIGTYIQNFIKTELSGNLVDLCPVGALTSKPYAYTARNWELERVETIDFFDSVCSDIIVHSRLASEPQVKKRSMKLITKDTILRILPKLGGLYEENWISDRTRFAFDGLKNQRFEYTAAQWEAVIIALVSRIDAHWCLDVVTSHIEEIEIKDTSARMGAVIGPICDLQGIYFLNEFIKLLGQVDIQVGNVQPKHNFDYAFYYNFNRTIASLNKLETLLIIGLNTRYEASLLNTILRKQQLQRALSYITIGAYSNLQLNQNHTGNSLRSLIAFSENRIKVIHNCYLSKNLSIFYGFENTRIKNGFLIQNIIRFLGKKFFTKTKQGERLGIVHSNISTLNFAHLGISAGVRSPLYSNFEEDKEIATLFAVQMHNFSSKKWASSKEYTHTVGLVTNKTPITFPYDNVVPIQSLYEKDGFSFNIEGRLRKFNKAVTAPKTARSLEVFTAALSRFTAGGPPTLTSLWNFENEIFLKTQQEKIAASFFINPFQYNEIETTGTLFPFAPVVTNFYLNDIISSNSSTMGECALFLNIKLNFITQSKQ